MELEQGRIRPYPNAPRPLDLDLLLYGKLIMETTQLTLPHPRMDRRLFVLTPLVEIWPDAYHPVKNQTASQLQNMLLEEGLDQDVTKSLQPW